MANYQIPLVIDFAAEEERIPLSIKIALGDSLVELIGAGSKVPLQREVQISNAEDNQESLTIRLVQGLSNRKEANAAIANYVISEIPPAPAGQLTIVLRIDLTLSLGIKVSARNSDGVEFPVDLVKPGRPLGHKAIAALSDEEANDAPIEFDGFYDRGIFHQAAVVEEGLDAFQTFVHTGMFLAWCIENELLSEARTNESKADIAEFLEQKCTGAQLTQRWGGNFQDSMLSEEGNAFAASYYNLDSGRYLEDYSELLAPESDTLLSVEDTWDNYAKIRVRISLRRNEWKEKQEKEKEKEKKEKETSS